jgi:hypothetical protein
MTSCTRVLERRCERHRVAKGGLQTAQVPGPGRLVDRHPV